jgi:chromosome segregation ATPase
MLKELIMSKLPKQDANDPKIEEAFKMIFDYESVRRIFANIEESRGTKKNYVEGFVDEMIEDIDDAIGDLKNQIDELKENKENEDDKKDQINKIKNEIKNSQAEKRQQKLKISQYRNQIRKILRCLEQMINEVREKYLDATLKKSLESSFKIFRITLNPQIDVLVDGFQASDRGAITSSAFNSNGSNFGKLAIKN